MPLDPFLQAKYSKVAGYSLADLVADASVSAKVDQAYSDERPYDPPPVRTQDEWIGPGRMLRVRVYSPAVARARSALVWAHGGGFTAGGLDMAESDMLGRELCNRAGVIVISVDYHLADGATVTYPALHREVIEAVRWSRSHAADLGADGGKIALGGASAGGNLALAAALELRDLGEEPPARLVLAYPLLSRRFMTSPAHEELMAVIPPVLRFGQDAIDRMFRAYLGGQADAKYASFEHTAFTGLPPMLVIVNEYDDLRLPAMEAAERARRDGVDVETYLARGVGHGHLNMSPALAETGATLDRIASYLAQLT